MIKILFTKTDNISKAAISNNQHDLPLQEMKFLSELTDGRKQIQRYAGRVLLQETIKRLQPESQVSLKQLQYKDDRPYFEGTLNCSIAHTRSITVCAASTTGSIGIDIEQITTIDLALYQTWFGKEEWQAVLADHTMFWNLWTKKEALAKATGMEFGEMPNTVSMPGDVYSHNGLQYYAQEIPIHPGYQCHLISTEKTPQVSLEEMYIN